MAGEKPVGPLEGIGSLTNTEINLDLLQEYQKAKGKIKQTVWIPVEYFIQTLQLSKKFGIANNILLATIIMAYYKNTNLFFKKVEIEKPVEIKTKVYVYSCIICWEEFEKIDNLKLHLSKVHQVDLNKLVKT
jgi:hypothetical protein